MWRQVNYIPDFAEHLIEKYDNVPMTSLKISAKLGKAYSPGVDDVVHFDGLLAFAVMKSLGEKVLILDKKAEVIFPVPMKIVWVSSNGLPLLASSDMKPERFFAKGVDYWHKRFASDAVQNHCKQPNTQLTKGAFKEYRIPIKTVFSDIVSAFCVGNKEEIEQLLTEHVKFIGKKSSQGKGLVLKWTVSEFEISENDILSNRQVPIDFSKKTGGSVRSWCAPHWFKPWHLAC